MTYNCSYPATADNGWVKLPDEYATRWPASTMAATLDFTEAGLIVACYERMPDLRDYREQRRKDYVRMRINQKMHPADACRHALHDVKNHIRFFELPIVNGRVELEWLVKQAKFSQPLRWVGFTPCVKDKHGLLDGIELWSEERYDKAMRDVAHELHVTQNKRVGWFNS